MLPWVGSVLLVFIGPWAVFAATLVSLGSIPIILRSLSLAYGPAREPVLRVVTPAEASKSAG